MTVRTTGGQRPRPLSLTHDVPLPIAPAGPAPAQITAAPHPHGGVPAGVDPGPTTIERVLDDLVPAVEALRRRLAVAGPAGFLVTAADQQRAREVGRLLDETARILAERA